MKIRKLKTIFVNDYDNQDGLDLSCLIDNKNDNEIISGIKYRRDLNRIKNATNFHSSFIKDQNIKSPFSDKQLSVKACYTPYIDTYHSILYEYNDKDTFYLIVGDYWYEKLGMYIPSLNLLILKRETVYEVKEMLQFLPLYTLRRKTIQLNKTSIILYHDHLAHHILNELNGIDHLIKRNLINAIDHIYYCDAPLGRLEDLFPEIPTSKFIKVSRKEINQNNTASNSIILPYQTAQISNSTITRINNYVSSIEEKEKYLLKEIRDKINSYDLCIWISIRANNRVLINQLELLKELKTSIEKTGKSIIYIIDGYSEPYKLSSRESENYKKVIREEKQVIDKIKNNKVPCIDLIGQPIQQVLKVSQFAKFYICHSGTLHHKISWFQDIPGIVHSNEHFSNLPDNLLPGMKEKDWKNIPKRISSNFITDSSQKTKDRNGNSLSKKFNNYSIDITKSKNVIMHLIKSEKLI